MCKSTIIYMGGFELPDKNAAAHRVIANGKLMQKLGYDVVYVGVNKRSDVCGKLTRYDRDVFGFECWSVSYPTSFWSWVKYSLGLSEILEFISTVRPGKVVGVVCYNYPAIAQLRINSLCRKEGIKLLADATEWYDASAGNFLFRLVKWLDTSLRIYISNVKSDGIITTSKYMTTFYKKKGKYTVELPTLFDTDMFVKPPMTKGGRRRKFIYVGMPFDVKRVNRKKTNLKERLDLSILLFSKLFKDGEDFDFDIYGISKDVYLRVFPDHESLLSEMAECVHFHGRQSNKLVLERIGDSDFSIFFRDENRVTLAGFPSKLAESITCGIPVLTNRMLSIEEYSGVPGLFIVEKKEELSLVRKLIKISPEELDVLKVNSFESKAFDYKNYRPQFRSFLDKIGV